MLIEVSNTLSVNNPTKELMTWCKKNLVIANPEYAKKARMNLWLGNTPKMLYLYEIRGDTLVLPFGVLRSLPRVSPTRLCLSANLQHLSRSIITLRFLSMIIRKKL